MVRIAVIKDSNGAIIDTTGINVTPIVSTNPNIQVITDSNNDLVSVNSHITLVTEAGSGNSGAIDTVDGGTF